jgi:transcriptional regulator with XRE-family HTH domain
MSKRVQAVDEAVGKRVRLLRLARSLSQSELASQIGVSFQQVQKYERGTNRMSASKLVAIADTLGVSVSDLFGDASNALGKSTALPIAVDVALMRTLSEMKDDKLKRAVFALVSALAQER